MDADALLEESDPGFRADPYAALAAVRALGPLPRHVGLGVRLAASHAVVQEVLRSRDLGRTFTPRGAAGPGPWETFDWLHAHALLENEPPTHPRLRRLVSGAFARGHVERLRPRVEQLAAELLDGCAAGADADGGFDVVAGYAEPLPVLVIAELLGWPEADRPLLRPWSQAIVAMYELDRTPVAEAAAQQAAEEFAGYVGELAARRAREPGDDLVSDLVRARDGSDRLSTRELVATVVLLLNAGHEASVNGFGNGLVSLLGSTRPGAAGEVPVAALVEEMLRHDAPLQLFERTAQRDTEVAGVRLRAGERVVALLGAANRDPAVFADPDTFVAGRTPNPQLAFGAGIHFCLGAPLARLELQVSVAALLRRWPALALVEVQRRPTFVLRGYTQVRVRPVTGPAAPV